MFLELLLEASSWSHTVSRNLNVEHSPVAPLENVRLLVFGWSVQVSLHQYDHPVLHRRSPGLTRYPKSCGIFPSRSTGCIKPSWLVSPSLEPLVFASQSVNLHWKSFLLDISLTKRSAFRSKSERKLLKWLQENIEKLIVLSKRRRWSHSSREKNTLWLECQQFGFWCQHIWLGSLVRS